MAFKMKGFSAFTKTVDPIIGGNKKTILLELAGTIFSLVNNLRASAKLWRIPKGPTTFGPLLS